MHRVKEFLITFWPTLIVVGVILYATLASDPMGADNLPPIPYLDKYIHAIMMGGLTGAIAFDMTRARKREGKNCHVYPPISLMYKIFLGVVLFSIADEAAQGMLTPNRSSEGADWIADCVGALIAVYAAPPVIRWVLGIKKNK